MPTTGDSGDDRPTITLTPPPSERLKAPPLPKRKPPVSGRTAGWVLGALVLVAGVIVGLSVLPVPDQPSVRTSPAQPGSASEATEAGCPEAVAKWIPGGGAGAVLVARYNADKYVVTVCRETGGQYRYDGQVRGVEASSKTHISLPATRTAAGFTARNKSSLYELSASDLVLSTNGKEQFRWTLVPLPR